MGTGETLRPASRGPEAARARPAARRAAAPPAHGAYRFRRAAQDNRTAGDDAARGAKIVCSAGFRHVQTPGPEQRRTRRDRREAVRETARRARPRGRGTRRGGRAGRGKRPAAFGEDAGRDAARIRPHAGRRPIFWHQKLPGRKGRRTPPHDRAQIRLYNREGRRRDDVGVSRGTPRRVPRVVAETERHRGVPPSTQERFGGAARAVKTKTPTVESPSACACRNVTFARGSRRGGRRPPPNAGEPAPCRLEAARNGTGASVSGFGRADHGGPAPPFQAGRLRNGVVGLVYR